MNYNEKNTKNPLYDNPAFPFVMFTVTRNTCIPPGPGYHYLHWHEDLQFTVVTKGSVSMMVNGSNFELNSHEGIFINSSFLHMTSHISQDGEYISFNFPTRMLSIVYGSLMETNYVQKFTMNYNLPSILLTQESDWQKQLIHMLLDLKAFCEIDSIYAKEYEIALRLESIWLAFIRNVKDSIQNSSKLYIRRQESMQHMLSFIHGNYAKEISLTDIAKAAHISQAECCRLFKKMLHTSPYEYLLQYRLNKSIDLLHETNLSVIQISSQVGFNDCSHFIQVFKKHKGQTPKNFRNQSVY